ncbi:MAG: MCE family protein [Actinobacteria bacterium]|nr:MCE family protein [Actinomycetota bacterium]
MSRRTRVLAIVAVLAVIASACGQFGVFTTKDAQTMTVQFPSTFNLFVGSDVRVAGVNVGQVSDIEVPEGSDVVNVTLGLEPDLQLPADVDAVIVPLALLGERYVQLDPPYTGGETYDLSRTLPIERTGVPADFDEVLDSLNEYLKGIPEDEVARLVSNLATVLDGNGDEIGQTLEHAETLIDVLQENDDEIVNLARELADLNETLATRDEQIGSFIEDFNTVAGNLADDRQEIDAAVDGLVRMTEELARLLGNHRGDLEEDIATLTRIGRTSVRNLGEIDRFLYWSAELYRHAERVIDREHNWLPLVQHFQDLAPLVADRVGDRLVGLCLRMGLPDCEQIDNQMPDLMCLDPILPCENAANPESTVPAAEALAEVLEQQPELKQRLEEEGHDTLDEALDGLGLGDATDGGGGDDSEDSEDAEAEDGDGILPPLSILRGGVR